MTEGALHTGAPASRAKALCVFVHGRGQSPEGMQSHVLARLDAPQVGFVLPRAPGGSWYAARAVDPLVAQTRAELGQSLVRLRSDIDRAHAAFPGLPMVLAGFSQGACLSLEYCFAGAPAPDALLAFTGCRLGVPEDDRPARLPGGLPVYLSGGDDDPWIPVEAFAQAALELGRSGAKLRCDLFPSRAHEVSDAEIAMLQSVLDDLAGGIAPAMEAAR